MPSIRAVDHTNARARPHSEPMTAPPVGAPASHAATFEPVPVPGLVHRVTTVLDPGSPIRRKLATPQANDQDKAVVNAIVARMAGPNQWVKYLADKDNTDIWLIITVNRKPVGGDHQTQAVWNADKRRTVVMIELNMGNTEGADQLEAALTHELILHGIPAAHRHSEAMRLQQAPVFPKAGSRQMAKEEKSEHENFSSWLTAVRLTIQGGSQPAVLELLRDWFNHAHADDLGAVDKIRKYAAQNSLPQLTEYLTKFD